MKRIPIVIILTACITCLFILFDTCSTDQPRKPDKEQFFQSEKQVNAIDSQYKTAFVFLQKYSDSLQTELGKTQKQLASTKLKLQQEKFDVVKWVEKDTSGLSIEQKLNDCDSLKQEVNDYVTWVDSTNSGYEKNISELNNLLAVKDSQIVVCTSSYSQLKSVTDENLLREQKLTEDLNTAYKQQRKNRIQNKFLAAGLLILSGTITTFLISTLK